VLFDHLDCKVPALSVDCRKCKVLSLV